MLNDPTFTQAVRQFIVHHTGAGRRQLRRRPSRKNRRYESCYAGCSCRIPGAAVKLDISAADGKVSISVIDQRDGQVHSVRCSKVCRQV